jgi:lysophospholipase L1-like esterase
MESRARLRANISLDKAQSGWTATPSDPFANAPTGQRYSRFDVVVLSMGANDATALCAQLQWARWQTRLAELIDLRFAPAFLVHSAVPPMHACLALPQPLRWLMGRWARQMNQSLAGLVNEQVGRTMHWHPETTTTAGMAADGIHPSSEGYATWADGLSRRILAAQVPRAALAA